MALTLSPALVTINAIDDRGTAVLSTFQSRLGADAPSWSQYITAAQKGNARAWILTILVSIPLLLPFYLTQPPALSPHTHDIDN